MAEREAEDIYILTPDEAASWPASHADWTVVKIPPGTDALLDRTIFQCLCGYINVYRTHDLLPESGCEACEAVYVPKEPSNG